MKICVIRFATREAQDGLDRIFARQHFYPGPGLARQSQLSRAACRPAHPGC